MPGYLNDRIDLQICIDGTPVQGLLQASIVTSNCFSSDSYGLTFAMGPLPMQDIIFWSTLSSSCVEINALTPSDLTPKNLITGMIDTINVDPIQRIVCVEGRDLSSSLIDSYRQQDFVNQTASEVVSTIALQHSLTPIVTATRDNVGRYYGDGYTRLSLGQFSRLRSDWDLLVQLARENGFDVFVEGRALFFQPSSSVDNPINIALRNIKAIRFEQAVALASRTTVRVQSWNSQAMTSYASNTKQDNFQNIATLNSPNDQPFLFSASNFTSQQVEDAAERYNVELSRLHTVLQIEMPWDLRLSPRTIILIDETKSVFDTTYKIESIERHYGTVSGGVQTVRAAKTA